MRISIVIVNYNYNAYLAKAIDSALVQTRSAAEVLVVDDGSTDGSRRTISRYGAQVQPVYTENRGHVAALNLGFAATTGEAILFLDADDILYPECLERAVAHMADRAAKVQFRLDTIDARGRNKKMPFPHFPNDLTPAEVLRQSLENGVYPWTVSSGNVFGREFLAEVLPLDLTKVTRSPDGYLNKIAPIYGDVISLPEVLGGYRVHGRNTWASATGDLAVYPANRWVKFDKFLCDDFEEKAASRGLKAKAYEHLTSVQRVEHRLLGLRFDSKHYPFPDDTAASLLELGWRCASRAPNTSSAGRALWKLWFFILAIAPLLLIRGIYSSSRAQGSRSVIARALIALARGNAHANPPMFGR